MCGLFGYLHYGKDKMENLSELIKSLAEQSTARGTDATGFAIVSKSGGIKILKDSKPAYKFNFKVPEATALIGHTRHSTSGFRGNHNHHPFFGKCKNTKFALAHNGVLTNDIKLRKQLDLPKTKIETDSYIAVQLLEHTEKLDFDSIKYMAETVEGSFSFSILDDKNNIYLVKGDSPLCILHFEKLGIYVFASTAEILYKALIEFPPTFDSIRKGEYFEVEITEGGVLKINSNGTVEKSKFNYSFYQGKNWWDYGCYGYEEEEDEYLSDLMSVAAYLGYSEQEIKHLRNCGYSYAEIEEALYDMTVEV